METFCCYSVADQGLVAALRGAALQQSSSRIARGPAAYAAALAAVRAANPLGAAALTATALPGCGYLPYVFHSHLHILISYTYAYTYMYYSHTFSYNI